MSDNDDFYSFKSGDSPTKQIEKGEFQGTNTSPEPSLQAQTLDEFASFQIAPVELLKPADQDEFADFRMAPVPTFQVQEDEFGSFDQPQSQLDQRQQEQFVQESNLVDDFGDFEAEPTAAVTKEEKFLPFSAFLDQEILSAFIERASEDEVVKSNSFFKELSKEIQSTDAIEVPPIFANVVAQNNSLQASAQLFKWSESMIRKMALVSVNIPTNVEDEITMLEKEQDQSFIQKRIASAERLRATSVPASPGLLQSGSPVMQKSASGGSSINASRSLEDLRDTFTSPAEDDDPFSNRVLNDSLVLNMHNNDDMLGDVNLPIVDSVKLEELCKMSEVQIRSHGDPQQLTNEFLQILNDLSIVLRHLEVGKSNTQRLIKDNNATISTLVRELKASK